MLELTEKEFNEETLLFKKLLELKKNKFEEDLKYSENDFENTKTIRQMDKFQKKGATSAIINILKIK